MAIQANHVMVRVPRLPILQQKNPRKKLKKLQLIPRIPQQSLKAKRVALQHPDPFFFKHHARFLHSVAPPAFSI